MYILFCIYIDYRVHCGYFARVCIHTITKAQDTRSINICQIFFSRFNDLFKTRPSAIGQKYNIYTYNLFKFFI